MSARRIGKWWWIDIRHQGVRYRKKSPHNTRGSAIAYEATVRQALATGDRQYVDPPAPKQHAVTFAEFADRWMAVYVAANNKPSEQRQKSQILRRHLLPVFGRRRLPDVTSAAVEEYKARKLAAGLAPKTVNNQLAVLGRCLRTAVEWNELDSCPRVKFLRATPPPFDYLSPAEANALLQDSTEPFWNDMVHVALRTGMRVGELLGLQHGDVDHRTRVITVSRSIVNGITTTPKNHRIRRLPMAEDLAPIFEPGRGASLVFARPNGEPLGLCMAEDALKRICRRAGIRPIGWHTLRHTFASALAGAGVPLTSVRDLLGHATIAMTMRYAHVSASALRDAIAVLERTCALPASGAGGQRVGIEGLERSAEVAAA